MSILPTQTLDDMPQEPPRRDRTAMVISPEEFTCYDCGAADRCEFAFDLYNLDGDCLADK